MALTLEKVCCYLLRIERNVAPFDILGELRFVDVLVLEPRAEDSSREEAVDSDTEELEFVPERVSEGSNGSFGRAVGGISSEVEEGEGRADEDEFGTSVRREAFVLLGHEPSRCLSGPAGSPVVGVHDLSENRVVLLDEEAWEGHLADEGRREKSQRDASIDALTALSLVQYDHRAKRGGMKVYISNKNSLQRT